MPDYAENNEAGKLAERDLACWLVDSMGGLPVDMTNDSDFKCQVCHPEFDLLDGHGRKWEVKRDLYHRKSGNVAVEVQDRGKPTGLSLTQSDWYAFVIDGGLCAAVLTVQLKRFIAAPGKPPCVWLNRTCGQSGQVWNWLIPFDKLKTLFSSTTIFTI
jgi:hypothetical protein